MTTTPDLTNARWRKALRSESAQGCVEVAFLSGDLVAVRDSKNPLKTAHVYPVAAWTVFQDHLRGLVPHGGLADRGHHHRRRRAAERSSRPGSGARLHAPRVAVLPRRRTEEGAAALRSSCLIERQWPGRRNLSCRATGVSGRPRRLRWAEDGAVEENAQATCLYPVVESRQWRGIDRATLGRRSQVGAVARLFGARGE